MDPAPRGDVELEEVAVSELTAGAVDGLLEDRRQARDRVPDAQHDHHERGEVGPPHRPATPVLRHLFLLSAPSLRAVLPYPVPPYFSAEASLVGQGSAIQHSM